MNVPLGGATATRQAARPAARRLTRVALSGAPAGLTLADISSVEIIGSGTRVPAVFRVVEEVQGARGVWRRGEWGDVRDGGSPPLAPPTQVFCQASHPALPSLPALNAAQPRVPPGLSPPLPSPPLRCLAKRPAAR